VGFDTLVRNGEVIDGTGAPARPADIGVEDGRVVAVGRLDGEAATVVDASGRLVVPGFIDAHCHADAAVLDPAVQLALLRQGVTTVVLGQDGLSYAPATPAALAFVTRYFAAVNGPHPGLEAQAPVRVAELLDTWRGTTAVNTAYLVPHGTLRYAVLGGAERAASAEELDTMRVQVEQGLADGAAGLSTGLEYAPGRYGDSSEVAYLCAPLASARLPYVTHMRGYDQRAAGGLAEAHAIGQTAGVAVHISHYRGPGPELSSIVDGYRDAGQDLTFDLYPYRRGCTILSMLALPHWLDTTDPDSALTALATQRDRVLRELNPDLWPRLTLAHVPNPDWAWTQGRRLTDAAAEAGLDAGQLLVELLVATRLNTSVVIDSPPTTTDDGLRMLLRHPAHIGGSDAIYIGGHPHPRGWGAFARFLGELVRARGDWTWPQAVSHLATNPAARFGLVDRGVLREGAAADLVVLDPAVVGDRADYDHPRELAVGVDDVLVNGVPVLRDGRLTGSLPGRPLTPYPGV
jgi:N-acyl-D-amino-acid deacylase